MLKEVLARMVLFGGLILLATVLPSWAQLEPPHIVGKWNGPFELGTQAIHGALTHTGYVVCWQGKRRPTTSGPTTKMYAWSVYGSSTPYNPSTHPLIVFEHPALHSGWAGSCIPGPTEYAEIRPGESLRLEYPYASVENGQHRKFVLATRGYYVGTEEAAESARTLPVERTPLPNALYQNAPNPFGPHTEIRYEISADSHVRIDVYDVQGRLVRTLVNAAQNAKPGGHTVVWDGTDQDGQRVSVGVYFYRLTAPGFESTRKMVVFR